MNQRPVLKVPLSHIAVSSLLLFLLLLIFFPFLNLKLIVLLLTVAIMSVIIIAKGLTKLSVARLRKLSQLTDDQLQIMAVKQYYLVNMTIILAALMVSGLVAVSICLIGIYISDTSKDSFVTIAAILGAALMLIGVFFILLLVFELIHRKKNKCAVINEIVNSAKTCLNIKARR